MSVAMLHLMRIRDTFGNHIAINQRHIYISSEQRVFVYNANFKMPEIISVSGNVDAIDAYKHILAILDKRASHAKNKRYVLTFLHSCYIVVYYFSIYFFKPLFIKRNISPIRPTMMTTKTTSFFRRQASPRAP